MCDTISIMTRFARRAALSVILVSVALAAPATAGPPFVTDDPEPTDLGHWEIYNYIQGVHRPGDTSGEAGVDFNYGGAKDLQLTAVFPAGYDAARKTTWGAGDIELAAKYKFLHQSGATGLDVAIFPRLFVPTGIDRKGDRRASLLVPLWAERDFGKWSVFGGGGYTFNPGPGARNYWVSGLTVTNQLTEKLQLGLEVYHQTPDRTTARDFTGVNVGGGYKLTSHWSLIGAFGPGVQHAREQGQYDYYAALKADF